MDEEAYHEIYNRGENNSFETAKIGISNESTQQRK